MLHGRLAGERASGAGGDGRAHCSGARFDQAAKAGSGNDGALADLARLQPPLSDQAVDARFAERRNAAGIGNAVSERRQLIGLGGQVRLLSCMDGGKHRGESRGCLSRIGRNIPTNSDQCRSGGGGQISGAPGWRTPRPPSMCTASVSKVKSSPVEWRRDRSARRRCAPAVRGGAGRGRSTLSRRRSADTEPQPDFYAGEIKGEKVRAWRPNRSAETRAQSGGIGGGIERRKARKSVVSRQTLWPPRSARGGARKPRLSPADFRPARRASCARSFERNRRSQAQSRTRPGPHSLCARWHLSLPPRRDFLAGRFRARR